MIQIHLQPEIEARLAAEAMAQGVDLERYIVEKLSQRSSSGQVDKRSMDETVARLRLLRKGNLLGGLKPAELIREGRKH